MRTKYKKLIQKYSKIDAEEKIYGTFQAIEESNLLHVGLLISIITNLLSGDILSLFISLIIFISAYIVSAQETIATITNKRVISLKKNKYNFLSKTAGLLMLIYSIFEALTKTLRHSIFLNQTTIHYITTIAYLIKIPPPIFSKYLTFIATNLVILLVFKSVIGFSNMFWFSIYVLRRRPQVSFFYVDSINEVHVKRKQRSRRIIKIIGTMMIIFGLFTITMIIGIFFIILGILLIRYVMPKYFADIRVFGREGTEIFTALDVESKYFPAISKLFGNVFLFTAPSKIKPKQFPEKVFPIETGKKVVVNQKIVFWKSVTYSNLLGVLSATLIYISWSLRLSNYKPILIGSLIIIIIMIIYYALSFIKSRRIKPEKVIIGDTYLMRLKEKEAWIIKTGIITGIEIKKGATIQNYQYAVHGKNKLEIFLKTYKTLISSTILVFAIIGFWFLTSTNTNPPFISSIIVNIYDLLVSQIGRKNTHALLAISTVYIVIVAITNQFIHGSTGFLSLRIRNSALSPIFSSDETQLITMQKWLAEYISKTSRPKRRPISHPPNN